MKERLIRWLFRSLACLNLRTAQAVGRVLGYLGWLLARREKRITLQNIDACFPDWPRENRRRLACSSMIETGILALEIPLMWEWPVDQCRRLIRDIEGEELLAKADADEGGILLLAPHLGNWELTGLYFASKYNMAALYSPPNQSGLENYMVKSRSRGGAEMVPTDRKGIVRLFQILKQGGVVGILPDQTPRRESGVYAPFFGMEALTMTLASKLAQKTRPTVLITYARRLPKGGGFRLVIREVDRAIFDEDPKTSLTALNRAVEDAVREAPAQYQWEYKRFRRQPEGQPSIYRSGA